MNQDQSNPAFDESIAQVMRTLPPPIRNYLTEGKCAVVAADLIRTYGLHVDQGGVLEREMMLLLMGIESPEEFMQALTEEAQIASPTVNSIMQDINTKIFVPLREQIRVGAPAAARPPAPLVAPRPTPAPAAMAVPKYYAPPPQSPAYTRPDGKVSPPASTIAPLPPKVVLPRAGGTPPINLITNSKPLPVPPETGIDFVPQPPPPTPPPVSKTSGEQTPLQQALRSVLPQQNLPGAPASDIMPSAPKAPPQQKSGADPYREPIE